MTQAPFGAPQPVNPNDRVTANSLDIAEVFRDLPVGSKVRMRRDVIAEVTANPNDGGWLFIRYVEFPPDPTKVGQEDMAFCADVIGVVEIPET